MGIYFIYIKGICCFIVLVCLFVILHHAIPIVEDVKSREFDNYQLFDNNKVVADTYGKWIPSVMLIYLLADVLLMALNKCP